MYRRHVLLHPSQSPQQANISVSDSQPSHPLAAVYESLCGGRGSPPGDISVSLTRGGHISLSLAVSTSFPREPKRFAVWVSAGIVSY